MLRKDESRITATKARKLKKFLGIEHPAVKRWQNIAAWRVADINKMDAHPRLVANPRNLVNELEQAKRDMYAAAIDAGWKD